MAYDPAPDIAALIDGLHEYAASGGSDFTTLHGLYTGPYARLRGGLLLDEPGQEHVSTENAIRLALVLAGSGTAPAAQVCLVCGQPLPHQRCQPVIIGAGTRQERQQ